jgi:hypothetical protein
MAYSHLLVYIYFVFLSIISNFVRLFSAFNTSGIVRIEKDFKPYFLSTFILSKYGRFQTLRESTGNVQLNLFIAVSA